MNVPTQGEVLVNVVKWSKTVGVVEVYSSSYRPTQDRSVVIWRSEFLTETLFPVQTRTMELLSSQQVARKGK
eukprot:1846301-Heterocapsa_arctica.AAC.1